MPLNRPYDLSGRAPQLNSSDSKSPLAFDDSPPRTTRTVLARNAALSLGTEVFIGVLLVATVPPLVHRLGPASFGLYSLAFALIGYLTYLDLGVSRAVTQFVSVALARNDLAETNRAIHSATLVNLFIGSLCSLAVVLTTPLLIHTVFTITPALQREAALVFYAVAVVVPFFLVQGVFRAVLMSYQRFGAISLINGVATSVQLLLALILAWTGFDVGIIVVSSVVVRIVAVGAYAAFLFRLIPGLLRRFEPDRHEIGALLHFGGWVTVSQIILQSLVYLDRFLLASFLSLEAITLYSVPYEGLTRLRVIPQSVMAALYPAMSEYSEDASRERLQVLYESSLRYLLLLLLPGISFVVVFGRELMSLWMGTQFAARASVVLQVLAAGFLLNSLAYVSYSAIQAFRKPEVVGKFHLIVAPIYLVLSVLLILRWGIPGAAVAAAVRFAVDAIFLFWVARKYCRFSLAAASRKSLSLIFSIGLALTIVFLGVRVTVPSSSGRLLLGMLAIFSYFAVIWRYVLDSREKPVIVRALNLFGRQATV